MCLKEKKDHTASGAGKTKLVMTAGDSGVGGRGGSPKPLRSQEALLCWVWMGSSRHFCQRVLEKQELRHHCTCLPWPSSLPHQISEGVLQTPSPTTLGMSCTFDTLTAILEGLQGSPSCFSTLASPSSVLLTPHQLCQKLTLSWCPCSQGASPCNSNNSGNIGHHFGKTLEPAADFCARQCVLQHGCLLQILLCRHQPL